MLSLKKKKKKKLVEQELPMNLKRSNAVKSIQTYLTLTSVLAHDDHPSCFYHGQLLNSLIVCLYI